jgi:hypothetical protein
MWRVCEEEWERMLRWQREREREREREGGLVNEENTVT